MAAATTPVETDHCAGPVRHFSIWRFEWEGIAEAQLAHRDN